MTERPEDLREFLRREGRWPNLEKFMDREANPPSCAEFVAQHQANLLAWMILRGEA